MENCYNVVSQLTSQKLSVIPINSEKIPIGSWEQYQTKIVKPESFNPRSYGIGIVCGKVSGNLECLDIDCKYDKTGTLWEDFTDRLDEHLPGILNCFVIQKTINNGYHLLYRVNTVNNVISGNKKLASNENGEVLLETRGEGGYFACYPTPGYSLLQKDFSALPTLSEEEQEIVWEVAQSFDLLPQKEFKPKYLPKSDSVDGVSPFDEYDEEVGNILHELEKHGWRTSQGRNGTYYLTRPGKQKGVSATINQKNRAGMEGRFYLFSSSVSDIPQGVLLKPSAVYTFLNYNGDFGESAKALYKEGFGDRMKLVKLERAEVKEGEAPPFWEITFNEKKETYSLSINQDDFLSLVSHLGYAPFYLPQSNDSIFIRQKDNVIEEVSVQKIKDSVMNHVDAMGDIINPTDVKEAQFTRKELRESLVTKDKTLFTETKLQYIKPLNVKFSRDTKDEAFFYFLNGFVRVTKSGAEFLPYSQLSGAIWNTQIIQREYHPASEGGDYESFVMNINGKNSERFSNMKTGIGYLLHRYKNPSNAKAIILNDEVISDSSEGGTGKSLIANAICQLRKVAKIDGKGFSFDNKFDFGCVGLDTDLVVFDDILRDFDFERLFHKITDGLEIEEKNKPKVRIRSEDSPKYLLTTNHVVHGENFSTNRRKTEYELAPHYGEKLTPFEEFGRNFFHDWDKEEWSRFDFFMFSCVQSFLEKGLKESAHTNLEYKKARQETHPDFMDWMEFYFGQFPQEKCFEEEIGALMRDFLSFSEEHAQLAEMNRFRQEKFTNYLKSYCKYHHVEYDITRKRVQSNGNRTRFFTCNHNPVKK